ncbi:hypothetical protein POMI540_1259 [Schizosaccharomyces pombe]
MYQVSNLDLKCGVHNGELLTVLLPNIMDSGNATELGIGVEEWHKRRSSWLLGKKSTEETDSSNEVVVPENVYLNVYEALVYRKQKLKRPVKLSIVIAVLKAGWIRDGFWPAPSNGVSVPP